jgi:hypothetical protein
MTLEFTLYGDTPSKKNSRKLFWREGKQFNVPGENYVEWHNDNIQVARSAKNKAGFKYEEGQTYHVEVFFYPSTHGRADCSNKLESVMDLIVDAGILPDDNWFVVPDPHPHFVCIEPKNPRAIVKISPCAKP